MEPSFPVRKRFAVTSKWVEKALFNKAACLLAKFYTNVATLHRLLGRFNWADAISGFVQTIERASGKTGKMEIHTRGQMPD